RVFQRVKLGQERAIDALAGLVIGPEIIPEGLDDVVGGDTEVGGPLLDHLQHRMQQARDRAQGLVLAFVEAALAVEVAEQLIGAVQYMHDHQGARFRRRCGTGSRRGRRSLRALQSTPTQTGLLLRPEPAARYRTQLAALESSADCSARRGLLRCRSARASDLIAQRESTCTDVPAAARERSFGSILAHM